MSDFDAEMLLSLNRFQIDNVELKTDLTNAREVLTAYDELVDSLRAEIVAKDAQVATAMENADRAFAAASAAKDREIVRLQEAWKIAEPHLPSEVYRRALAALKAT